MAITVDFDNVRETNTNIRKDIIRSSSRIRQLLIDRFKELGLKAIDVIADAKEKGLILNEAGYSRYFSNDLKNGNVLTQYQILWLCVRYNVIIDINVSRLPYNEKECLKRLKQLTGE